MASLLSLWPSFRECVRHEWWVPAERPVSRKGRKTTIAHECVWSVTMDTYRCSKCGRSSATRRAYPCTGTAPTARHAPLATRFHKSHHMMVTDLGTGADELFFCNTCGAYSQEKAKRLTAPCVRVVEPRTPPWYPLERLRKGHHPITDKFFTYPVRWYSPLVRGTAPLMVPTAHESNEPAECVCVCVCHFWMPT